MSKDPAFLFYPGDYLRDTQNLGEKTQVAYDRIMCEHMRNICISKQQLNFFTKRLSGEEKSELMLMLSEVKGGYHIEWVADSITKRKAYSESRRKNREGKGKDDMLNISSTYDPHMENVNEDEDKSKGKVVYRQFDHLSITTAQAKKLAASGYTKPQIDSTLDSIENFKGNTKYKSLYLTAKKWLEKERKTKETTLGGRDIKLEKVREGYGERTPQDVKMPDSLKKKFGIK